MFSLHVKSARASFHRLKKASKKFQKNEEGALAIEFAFVVIPFFLIFLAIAEVSLVLLAEVNITHATMETARKVRTGQAAIASESAFIADVCRNVQFVPDCNSKLQVEVQVYSQFNDVVPSNPLDPDGELKDDFVFNLGGPNSVITVRTFLEWDLIGKLPDLGLLSGGSSISLGNMPNGNRLVQGFAVFRNEAF